MSAEAGLGATYLGDGHCQFLVWAPLAEKAEVHIASPGDRLLPLERDPQGYHRALAEDIYPGYLYQYRLDGRKELADPAARLQPGSVYGPSQVVDTRFAWEDGGWRGLPLGEYIIYELHTGTFTQQGTFDAIIPRLDELKELGITALELMPVAQFPGSRNWGYDGVYPFAAQNSYGGVAGLQRLVNACHRRGLAVILDVVYNHLGPEGNYLAEFAPYFTDRYRTPWGAALNFDGPDSDHVRRFFIENALYWVTDLHIDTLRLDALHAILDISPYTFLQELADRVQQRAQQLKRQIYLIGESVLNDARLIRPRRAGGTGLDAQWNDDWHHSLHALLTGERSGYYRDFGQVRHLAKAFREGFVYSGEYSPYFHRRQGTSSRGIPAQRFVAFAQNHDQVGNRLHGERLSRLVDFESLKLAAAAVLLSPSLPLLFMGEEYGETAPFNYFISHSDPALIEAVRRGRRDEFAAFQWQGEIADPQDEATFQGSKLNSSLSQQGQHAALYRFYRELIRLRRQTPALAHLSKDSLEVLEYGKDRVIFMRRWQGNSAAIAVFNFGDAEATIALPFPEGRWRKRLDSAEPRWQGAGSSTPEQVDPTGEAAVTIRPKSAVLFAQEAS